MEKKNDVQNLRESQFVLTYGPGAIIETKNGARLIPLVDRKGILAKGGVTPQLLRRYEITDTRLSAVIKSLMNAKESVHIFTLPSSPDDIHSGYGNIVYGTQVFPRYFICYNSSEHKKRGLDEEFILFYASSPDGRCPVCGNSEHTSQVRFVMACPNGHLDDVNWIEMVHGPESRKCRGRAPEDVWFYWKPKGTNLDSIEIECPECGAKITVGDIYRKGHRGEIECTGRRPEEERPPTSAKIPFLADPERKRGCRASMRVIQRQSSSLRVPETLTLLTIPQLDRRIAELLQIGTVFDTINTISAIRDIRDPEFINDLERALDRAVEQNRIDRNTAGELIALLREGREEFLVRGELVNLMRELALGDVREVSFMEYIRREFESIIEFAESGRYESEGGNFAMGPPVTIEATRYTPRLKVYPVEKLRTVTAQVGYTRPVGGKIPSRMQSVHFRSPDGLWYPGFVGRGEGIFIVFEHPEDVWDYLNRNQNAVRRWSEDRFHEKFTISPWSEIAHKPLFVWLHTLSHSIMKSIYMMSGYSMASIRERIYLSRDDRGGGILLYTTSPSADGSMGGLILAARNMERIISSAIESLLRCSNDPLCIGTPKKPDNPNGAACYSCIFVSETSCEHGNRWLDRQIIVGDSPWFISR